MDKIFSKKPKQEGAIETQSTIVEELVQEIEPEKSLEYYEEKKQELKELYTKRSGEAVKYQNKKDRIDDISPDEPLNSKLTEQAHSSTLGVVNEKIKEISEEGIGLTKQEHYEAREKMLQDELERVNKKIEEFKQIEIYPNNESARNLLSLKERVATSWGEGMPYEEKERILSELSFASSEARLTAPSTYIINVIDQKLGEISDTFSEFGKPKHVEYKELLERKQKIHEIIADWEVQNIEKSY